MKKFMIPALAAILALGFSAFTPVRQAHKPSMTLYWYKVDRSTQKILAGTPLFAYADKADVETDCDDTAPSDCLRGFTNPQNTSVDITASGFQQIHNSED